MGLDNNIVDNKTVANALNVGQEYGSMGVPKVKILYGKYLSEGKTPKDAARMAQELTGDSVVTGRPINRQLPYRRKYAGQYKSLS